jgi:hypothetical protein
MGLGSGMNQPQQQFAPSSTSNPAMNLLGASGLGTGGAGFFQTNPQSNQPITGQQGINTNQQQFSQHQPQLGGQGQGFGGQPLQQPQQQLSGSNTPQNQGQFGGNSMQNAEQGQFKSALQQTNQPQVQQLGGMQSSNQNQGQFPQTSQPKSETASSSDDLPDGWQAVPDPASGQSYYWNQVTNEVTWTKPEKPKPVPQPTPPPAFGSSTPQLFQQPQQQLQQQPNQQLQGGMQQAPLQNTQFQQQQPQLQQQLLSNSQMPGGGGLQGQSAFRPSNQASLETQQNNWQNFQRSIGGMSGGPVGQYRQ